MGESQVVVGTPRDLVAEYGDRVREVLAPIGAGILVVGLGASSGGYFPTSWGWTGVLVAVTAILALVFSNARLGFLELSAVGFLAAYVGWVAASRLWSDAPGHTI